MTSRFVVRGTVRAPGDKSISHRALILAALGDGASRVHDLLQSADVQSTAGALRALGVDVPALGPDIVVIGRGVAGLHGPRHALDCGNSGTTTRLLAGVMAGLVGRDARFEGDASLSRRPMRRVAAPLQAMGARIEFEGAPGHDGLPMRVFGAELRGIDWRNAHASAQVKSAVLLASLVSGAESTFREPERSRDHTERMLSARGVAIELLQDGVRMPPHQRIEPADVVVPADPSSAAFFMALAALADDAALRLPDVCLNPTRTGALDVLRRMGAAMHVEDERLLGGEPVGTITAGPGTLVGTHIGGAEVPRCIDELPLLACVAARAHGETVIADAAELRVKESDRIHAVVENLRGLGVDATEEGDGMRIVGSRAPLRGHVITHGDHRLAMAFGVLAAVPGNSITIDDPGCVAVSFPTFWTDLARVVGSVGVATGRAGTPTLPHDAPAAAAAPARRAMVIAIDGPAASGKSSTAQWVARRLGVRHVDSGAFYRAITYVALRAGVADDAWTPEALLRGAGHVTLRLTERSVLPLVDGEVVDEALRAPDVTRRVSLVAQMGPVRDWVNALVREASAASDVVVDGRDIGTAVFPDAPLKVFLVADPWERARRRLMQRLRRAPADLEIAEEAEALVFRDAQDAIQSVPARDALTIDTTALTQEEQVERIVALARAAMDRLAR